MLTKFLYFDIEDGLLVAGGYSKHKELGQACVEIGLIPPTSAPTGAGDVRCYSVPPTISSWDSLGYNVETPIELHSLIADALGVRDIFAEEADL